MRGNPVLEDLIVCAIALSPLRAISADATLLRAWIDFASCNWVMCYPHGFGVRWASKFILPGAFLALTTAAQAQAALTALREELLRQVG